MPEAVVDVLEIIQINKQKRQLLLIASGEFNVLFGLLLKKRPVGQPGQTVKICLLGQLFFQLFQMRNITADAKQADDVPGLIKDRALTGAGPA